MVNQCDNFLLLHVKACQDSLIYFRCFWSINLLFIVIIIIKVCGIDITLLISHGVARIPSILKRFHSWWKCFCVLLLSLATLQRCFFVKISEHLLGHFSLSLSLLLFLTIFAHLFDLFQIRIVHLLSTDFDMRCYLVYGDLQWFLFCIRKWIDIYTLSDHETVIFHALGAIFRRELDGVSRDFGTWDQSCYVRFDVWIDRASRSTSTSLLIPRLHLLLNYLYLLLFVQDVPLCLEVIIV